MREGNTMLGSADGISVDKVESEGTAEGLKLGAELAEGAFEGCGLGETLAARFPEGDPEGIEEDEGLGDELARTVGAALIVGFEDELGAARLEGIELGAALIEGAAFTDGTPEGMADTDGYMLGTPTADGLFYERTTW